MENMFESDAGLPLGKILCNPIMIIVARSVFQKDIKYYLKVYLQECRYKL